MGHLTKTANDIVSAVEKLDHVKELVNGKLPEYHWSCLARKPVISDLVRHKPGCTTTEDGKRLRKKQNCTI